MSPFNLKIITPTGVFYDGDCNNVIVRTTVGDKGVLARHEPYIAALPIGKMRIMTDGQKYRTAAVSTGTIQVEDGGDTVVLVQSCEWSDGINFKRAEDAKTRAETQMNALEKDDVKYKIAEFKLKRALNRLDVVGK
jgi:F-type H+-transporting ATPase subunit epsilon